MKKNILIVGAILALFSTAANAEIVILNAVMEGAQADDCNGSGSSSTGTGTFALNTVTFEVDYTIEYSPLDGTEIGAHIHFQTTAEPCSSGPVVIILPEGSPKIGNFTLSEEEADEMLAGLTFVLVHTDLHNAGGEIRGQILVREPVPAVSEWGMLAMALLTLTAGTIAIARKRLRTASSRVYAS